MHQRKTKKQNIDKPINLQNGVVLEEDTVGNMFLTWLTSTITVGKL